MGCLSMCGIEVPDFCLDYSDRQKRDAKKKAKYCDALKRKIDELCRKREAAEPLIVANGGDTCNLPCYEYQEKLAYNCPKCGGRVKKYYENGKTIKSVYNEKKGVYEERTYYDINVCTKFNWIEDYNTIDMDTLSCLKYFTRRETIDKDNWVEYFSVDGQRYDAPPNTLYKDFFAEYNDYFFPKSKLPDIEAWDNPEMYERESGNNTCFFFEKIKPELGQSLGFYGYEWKHYVYIFECLKCKYKYHILRTSPFKFRDKSLDKYIDCPAEYQKLINGNNEQMDEQKEDKKVEENAEKK